MLSTDGATGLLGDVCKASATAARPPCQRPDATRAPNAGAQGLKRRAHLPVTFNFVRLDSLVGDSIAAAI